jgi:tetratricopeptide (TPR) repeat protein
LNGPDDSGPEEGAVKAALAAALASEPFRDAPQLKAFLTFIVNETLAGRADDLKGYSIATLALGRPESFDPQTDPIVRVQAGRLRQALAEYHDAHPDAPVVIRLERGSYEPVFERAAAKPPAPAPTLPPAPVVEAPSAAPAPPAAAASGTRRRLLIGAGMAAASAAAIASYLSRPAPAPAAATPQPEAFYPTLTVEADLSGGDPDALIIAGRLRDAIARFDDIVVVGDSIDMAAAPASAPPPGDWGLVLRLATIPSGGNQIRIAVRLLNRRDQRLLWSREVGPVPRGQEGDRALSSAIRTIASTLAQPYGVIHAHVRGLLAGRTDAKDPFGCVVAGLDYWLVNDRASHLQARRCIEDRLKLYPAFGPLHAQLTYLHLEEYRQGHNVLPGDARSRALESARRAVLHRPASARSHQSLMAALFASGDLGGAWRAAADALSLNPNDTEIIADVGSYRVMAGDFEEGLAYLDQAIDLNAAPPAWVVTFRAMAHYMLGRLELSGPMARTLEGSNYPLAQMALILAAFQYRDLDVGRRHLDAFRRQNPDVAANPEAFLRRMNFNNATLSRVMADFNRALAWLRGG